MNQSKVPWIPQNDVQYIDGMVPHHQAALEMAQMEVEKGTRADVKALAQSIKDDQTQEIQTLTSVRAQLTGSATVPPPPSDPHMEMDMEDLMNATGAAVDEKFLEHMIPHHASAIVMADRALPNLTRSETQSNARNVISSQATEIGEMQKMRQ